MNKSNYGSLLPKKEDDRSIKTTKPKPNEVINPSKKKKEDKSLTPKKKNNEQ